MFTARFDDTLQMISGKVCPMLQGLKEKFLESGKVCAAALSASLIAMPMAADADGNIQNVNYGDVKADYITDCTSNSCAPTDASLWSDQVENWSGVAVSVAMGTQPARTDQQIKDYLTKGFEHFGVKNYKFFFEQNDVPVTGISFHVRGGTSDLYTLADNLVPVIERYSRQANDPNFASKDANE